MNFKEIKKLIQIGESEKIEFKKSTAQQRQATKSICAMLNHKGGCLIYGINDNGTISGQEVTAKTLEKLIAEHRLISPSPSLTIETLDVSKNRKIIIVKLKKTDGLFTYENRAYLKQGSTTYIMPREEYENRLMENVHGIRRWENELAPKDLSISDLDEEEILITYKNGVQLGRIKPQKSISPKSILRGLKLTKDGKLLNAAIALYGKSEDTFSYFPQFAVITSSQSEELDG